MPTTDDGDRDHETTAAARTESGRRRSGWVLGLAALVCVVVGGVVGFAVSELAGDASGTDELSSVERYADISQDGAERSATQAAEPTPTESALFNRVPATDRPCSVTSPDAAVVGMTATVICGSQTSVQAIYEQYDSTAALRASYDGLLGEIGIEEGQAPTPCPNTVPSDSAVERNGVVTGRLACFESGGRQWIVWTSEPLNTLVVARGADGMSAIAVHEWWQQTDRPILTDDELVFFARVPEGHRAACDFRFVSFSQVQSVPPPERGSTALCFLPSTTSPDDPLQNMAVVYRQHFTAEAMNADFSAIKSRWGVTPDAGTCPESPPGEGTWNQGGATAGSYACAVVEGRAVMAWTTDPVTIMSFAIAALDMTMADLWEWWANESGPLYRKG